MLGGRASSCEEVAVPEGTTAQKRGSESPELSKPSALLWDEVRPPGTCLHCLFRSPKHIVFVSPVCLSPSQPAKGSVADPGGSLPRSEHPVSPQHVLKPPQADDGVGRFAAGAFEHSRKPVFLVTNLLSP